MQEPEQEQTKPRLTPRETQVVQFVVDGLTTRQIARRLTLSPRTVENHITHARQRGRVPNRAALVHWALKHKLVS